MRRLTDLGAPDAHHHGMFGLMAAAMAENRPAGPQRATGQARFPELTRLRHMAQAVAVNFRLARRPGAARIAVVTWPRQAEGAPPALPSGVHDAVIDRWGQAQEQVPPAFVCSEIKAALRADVPSRAAGPHRVVTSLHLNDLGLTSIPAELSKAGSLQKLDLFENRIGDFPAEFAQAQALRAVFMGRNRLTTFPAEMCQAKSLETLELKENRLTSFPAAMGQAQALKQLDLGYNRLEHFPAEMGQAKALQILHLNNNRLTALPDEIAGLSNLRYLDLSYNLFTTVPPALLDLPETTEIDLRHNPIAEADLMAVREMAAQRRRDGRTVPQLLLRALQAEAGELREVAANGMNVHTTVLTDAFKKRLNDVARQFPQQLNGSVDEQRTELSGIAARLTQALERHATHHAPSPDASCTALHVANLMFEKGQGAVAAFYNEFNRSAGHVLAYTFLAIEAQVARTPVEDRAEASHNGMSALIRALENGSGNCDTRLCEEVMQVIGLPLSGYAQQHPDIIEIKAPEVAASEARDVTLGVAKSILLQMLETGSGSLAATPSAAWRARLLATMQREHPVVTADQVEQAVRAIESAWPEFYELVNEQRAAGR